MVVVAVDGAGVGVAVPVPVAGVEGAAPAVDGVAAAADGFFFSSLCLMRSVTTVESDPFAFTKLFKSSR